MAAGADSIFFVAGGVLAFAALAALWRALLSDRSRGRRRCPKCWYDMSGVPGSLTCSECGHVAKRERQLFKTRRRWRLAIIGVLMLLLADACTFGPRIRQEGWFAVAPTTMLVMMMPSLQNDHPAAFDILMERADEGKLWQWQWSMLLKRSFQEMPWRFNLTERPADDAGTATHVALHFEQSSALFNNFSPTSLSLGELRARVLSSGNGEDENLALDSLHRTFPRLRIPIDGDHVIPSLTVAEGRCMLDFDVVIERKVFKIVPVVSSSGSNVRLGSPSSWPVLTGIRTFVGWTPIRIEHLHMEVDMDLRRRGPMSPRDDSEITDQLRSDAYCTIGADYLGIGRRGVMEPMSDMCGAVRIDLMDQEKVLATYLDWWQLDAPDRYRQLFHRIALPPSVQDAQPLENGSHWHIRVRSDRNLATWATNVNSCWSGEFTLPITVVAE